MVNIVLSGDVNQLVKWSLTMTGLQLARSSSTTSQYATVATPAPLHVTSTFTSSLEKRLQPVMLSPRGQTVLEAEILSSASTSCPRPRPRASGLGMSSDFVTWPRAYVCFTTKPKPMICIRHYVPCHPSTNLLFTTIYLLFCLVFLYCQWLLHFYAMMAFSN